MLRLHLIIASALGALLLAAPFVLGAQATPPSPPANPPAKPSQPKAPPRIPLRADLRFTIRPTLLGLVPPDDPLGFGELLVRIVSAGSDALAVRYELKEQIAATPEIEHEADKLPESVAAKHRTLAAQLALPDGQITRVRRGAIEISGMHSARRFENPLFWGDGDWQTDSSLLWLSAQAYQELKSSTSAQFSMAAPLAAAGQPDALAQYTAQLVAALGAAPDSAPQLWLTSYAVSYPCYVNGERSALPALLAIDNLGLAEYWVLDDPDNPLILKVSFIAPKNTLAAAIAPDTLSAAPTKPSADAERDRAGTSDLLKRQQQRHEQEASGEVDSAAAAEPQGIAGLDAPAITADGLQQLIQSGGGYAITAIDF
jgi:hypothetical protein